MTSGGNSFNDFPENGHGTASPDGEATTLGGETPDTGCGTPF